MKIMFVLTLTAKTSVWGLLCVGSVLSFVGQQALDITLLIDSSDGHRSSNFDLERRFLTEFVTHIFSPGIRISVFTFGENTYSQFSLNDYNKLQDLNQAIRYLWFSTGNGDVAPAITHTIETGFSETAGERECVPNILVVLTHSALDDNTTIQDVRAHIEEKSINVYVINLNGTSAERDFAAITNSSTKVYTINQLSDLATLGSTILHRIETDTFRTGCGVFTTWSEWTGCSVTCGYGSRFRLRYCKKEDVTDKDCEGQKTQYKVCQMPNCTDPVDGAWSTWQSWGSCSKTCEKGLQKRVRTCTDPEPRFGGSLCKGPLEQTRECADWECPDCNRRCPTGAHVSSKCDSCECSSVTLFGKIMNSLNQTVKDAEVFLESRRYIPIATTNDLGLFQAQGLCMMNEVLFVHAKDCENKYFTAIELNSTHWTLKEDRLNKYVPPVFVVRPEDKVRMIGDSLSLCCHAIGFPPPKEYKWFKDDIELEGMGTNGTLELYSVVKNDTGHYWCYTETDAGVSLSDKITVTIHDRAVDTCSHPLSKFQDLPHGCFVTGDTLRNNSIDVGDCGKVPCMKSSLHDNGSCSDYWPHHCCNPKETELVNISCDGFSYQTTRVLSCECKQCVFKTLIFGRAIGRQNGSDIPLKLGQVLLSGKQITRTNAAGFFSFDVPREMKRVVATFQDDYYKKFEDTTKIFIVNPGGEVFLTVVIPMKPEPIHFDSDNGTEVHLGGNNKDKPPGASLEILPNSLMSQDGQVYNGPVKATFNYIDPRNREDLDAANGEFETETSGGEKQPLKTFGMFQIGFKDNTGNVLNFNKPIKFSLDSSVFNIPVDEKGKVGMALWSYDRNKGIWKKFSEVQFEQASTGSRRLLAAGRFVAEFSDPTIPDIQHERTITETVRRENMWLNKDGPVEYWHWVKTETYETVTRREVLDEACFVSVSVYKNLSLTEPFDSAVEITAYVKELDDSAYVGKKTITSLMNGHACVPVLCNRLVQLHVNSKGSRLYAGEHYLPSPYYVQKTKDNEVTFESTDFGKALNCSADFLKPKTECHGPIYPNTGGAGGHCNEVVHSTNSFQFKFAPFANPPILNEAAGKGQHESKLSWYPVSNVKSSLQFRSCFIKIRVDIERTFDLRAIAISYLQKINGEQFGSYLVGPVPDPRKDDNNVRCACLEFRCPGYIKDSGVEIFDRDTAIEVRLFTGNPLMNCKIRDNARINITKIQDATKGDVGFNFIAKAGNNYGRNYGVFIHDKSKEEALQICENGIESGPQADGLVDPKRNPAVEFNCI